MHDTDTLSPPENLERVAIQCAIHNRHKDQEAPTGIKAKADSLSAAGHSVCLAPGFRLANYARFSAHYNFNYTIIWYNFYRSVSALK